MDAVTMLGDVLTAELASRGWPQAELARKLQVSPQAVSQWANAPSPRPRLDKIRRLVALFDWDTAMVRRLFGDDAAEKLMTADKSALVVNDPVDLRVRTSALPNGARRLAVVGAGKAGASVVRDLLADHRSTVVPMVLVDDDPRLHGTRIHGVRVVGTVDQLSEIVRAEVIDEVLIAIPSCPQVARRVAKQLAGTLVRLNILPDVDTASRRPRNVGDIRELCVEDLVASLTPDVEDETAAEAISGATVVVTGAGGWLGSHVARRVLSFGPRSLLLVDRNPTHLDQSLLGLPAAPGLDTTVVRTVVADPVDPQEIDPLIEDLRPAVVFHMAGHKPSPTLERSPCQAVLANLIGFVNVLEAARRAGTRALIAPSNAKAVRPLNVMGQIAWLRERYLEQANANVGYHLVRIGELADSPHGVISRLRRQFDAGENLTIPGYKAQRRFLATQHAANLLVDVAGGSPCSPVVAAEFGETCSLLELANMLWLNRARNHATQQILVRELIAGEDVNEQLVGQFEVILKRDQSVFTQLQPPVMEQPIATETIKFLRRLAEEQRGEAIARELARLTTCAIDGDHLARPEADAELAATTAVH